MDADNEVAAVKNIVVGKNFIKGSFLKVGGHFE
jgi:hypothetical protein